ncbi:MAG: ribosome recycling factor [Candidatus Makaraimicrobium thalassicum]|nr:MAG: ribosome recycling factor [Candidatus Omnitrophota bacterium]
MIQTEVDRIVKETEDRMQTALESVRKQFSTIRTGRAHPALVESVKVDYYGTKTPLKQLASVSAPEPRLIVIQPWDKGSMAEVEKAILASDVGITPTNDGKVIRLSMPQLTQERRDELVKVLHRIAEEGKISLRNARHNANEEAVKLEKENKMTEDDKFLTKERTQKLIDQYIKKVDTLLADKEEEIKS